MGTVICEFTAFIIILDQSKPQDCRRQEGHHTHKSLINFYFVEASEDSVLCSVMLLVSYVRSSQAIHG